MFGRIVGMLARHEADRQLNFKNMDVKFADSFFSSLKRMANRNRWYWKAWELIRYDLPNFFKNLWLFRKALWNYRWYGGHHGVFPFMRIALMDMAAVIDRKGHEEDNSRSKKVMKMWRVAKLLENFENDEFITLAEKELGAIVHGEVQFVPTENGTYVMQESISEEDRAHNRKVYALARDIEESMWNELWAILKGQDIKSYIMFKDKSNHPETAWDNWFDGSDIRGWWD